MKFDEESGACPVDTGDNSDEDKEEQ